MTINKTSLIQNTDGSIYHLNLFPGELAKTIFLVGDPDRVSQISQHFDRIIVKKQKREFVTHTGYLHNQLLSVMSTGIGVSNIDIVINEVDALFNIDFKTRTVKYPLTSLKLIRLGTSGALQPEIPIDSFIVSDYAVAFDGALNYYRYPYQADEKHLLTAVQQQLATLPNIHHAYTAKASTELTRLFRDFCAPGLTLTMGGFYGPQSRQLRAPLISENMIEQVRQFHFQDYHFTNFEMETAGIYGLCNLLGHQGCSINSIIANRITDEFSKNSVKTIQKMIKTALEAVDKLFHTAKNSTA